MLASLPPLIEVRGIVWSMRTRGRDKWSRVVNRGVNPSEEILAPIPLAYIDAESGPWRRHELCCESS